MPSQEEIPRKTVENLCKILEKNERLLIFNALCERIKFLGDRSKARIAERIAIETGMDKTQVYRYLNNKSVPNPKTTSRVINALLNLGDYETVVRILDLAAQRMSKTSRNFYRWKKSLAKKGIIYDSLRFD